MTSSRNASPSTSWARPSAELKLASARAKQRLALISSCGSGIAILPQYCNEFARGSYYPTKAEGHSAREPNDVGGGLCGALPKQLPARSRSLPAVARRLPERRG